MNIGIVIDNEFDHDIRVVREAKVLRAAGHKVFVLCYDHGRKMHPDMEGLKTVRIPLKKKWKDILFFLFHVFPF
ncbi:MAG TPA: glycosyl transferase family 1, partial [Bacteroidetes bacterium]|nr:glycosyl transferase family 1 [Bacteroidota bacterium]